MLKNSGKAELNEKKYKEQLEFQQSLKNILKYSKKFCEASQELATSGSDFARELYSLSKKEWMTPYEKMSAFLFDYSTVINQIGSVCTQMLEQMQTEFCNSVALFIDHGFSEATAAKNKMEEAINTYESTLSKVDEASKKGKLDETKMLAFEDELNNLKKGVDSSTVDFQSAMVHLDANKEFKFLRYLYQHLELQTTYFLVGHKLYDNLIKKIDPVKKHIEHLDAVSPYRNIVEGYLLKKGKNLGGYKKIWVVLKHGQFITIKGKKVSSLDMRLCTVKLANSINMQIPASSSRNLKDSKDRDSKESDKSDCAFEIVSAQKKILFHAETQADRDRWVKAVQTSISDSLNNSNFESQEKSSSNTESPALKILRKEKGNHICADCDVRDPDWASINLGILVCLECSGVHRSLGTHISKVRSLTLDKWDPELLLFMKFVGNNNANSIYEFNITPGYTKPTKGTDRESREKFIKAKYVAKEFIPTTCLTQTELTQSLCTMVGNEKGSPETDILGVMLLLAQGADPNTAMAYATNANNVLYYTALLQNGAQPTNHLHTSLTLDDLEADREVSAFSSSSPTNHSNSHSNAPSPIPPLMSPDKPSRLSPARAGPPLPPRASMVTTPLNPASPPIPTATFRPQTPPVASPPTSPTLSLSSSQEYPKTLKSVNSMSNISSPPLPSPSGNGNTPRKSSFHTMANPVKPKSPLITPSHFHKPLPSPTSPPAPPGPPNEVEQLFAKQPPNADAASTQQLHHQIQQQLQLFQPSASTSSIPSITSNTGGGTVRGGPSAIGKLAASRRLHMRSNSLNEGEMHATDKK